MRELEIEEQEVIKEVDNKKANPVPPERPFDHKIVQAAEYAKKWHDGNNREFMESFLGNNYTLEQLRHMKQTLSMDRTGGYSVAMLALLAEKNENGEPKYTIEQLYDPNQLREEKQAKFKEVAELNNAAAEDKNNEAGKKLFEMIVAGQKALNVELKKMVNELDLNDENFEYSEQFQKVSSLASIGYDAWQELWRFENQAIEYAMKEAPNRVKGDEDARDYTKEAVGPFSDWGSYNRRLINSHMSYKKGDRDINSGLMVSGALVSRFMKDKVKEWKKQNKKSGIDFFSFCIKEKLTSKLKLAEGGIITNPKVTEICRVVGITPGFDKEMDKRCCDGSFFKNIKISEKKGRFVADNIPLIDLENKKFVILPPKDLPVNFDSYITLHTLSNGFQPKNQKEKEMAICKALAAYSLKKLGRKFDKKEIREMAEVVADGYNIKDSFSNEKRLDEILKDRESILKFGQERQEKLYNVTDFDKYAEDMATLRQYMMSEEGHSTEYVKFAKAVEAASKLKETTRNMTPEEKAKAYRYANMDVVSTADKYMKGKEKIRWTTKGEDCFNNAMDALAIVSKYTAKTQHEPTNGKVFAIIARVADVRTKAGQDISDIDIMNFEQTNGAARAKARSEEKLLKKQGKKQKDNANIRNSVKKAPAKN